MEEQKQLTSQESLQLIQQMIQIAKQEQKDDGKGWILWGWLLFAASVFTFINIKLRWVPTYFFWNAFGIVTMCFFFYTTGKYFFFKKTKGVRTYFKKTKSARTYTGDLLQKLDIGFFISIMFIVIAINIGSLSPMVFFPLLVNIYGFRILIHGAALNFKPWVVGAFITWFFGLIGLFVKTFDWVMLTHAAAVLCGYIIPGHIANNEFKKTKPMAFNKNIFSV
jgi:hypothetical protein